MVNKIGVNCLVKDFGVAILYIRQIEAAYYCFICLQIHSTKVCRGIRWATAQSRGLMVHFTDLLAKSYRGGLREAFKKAVKVSGIFKTHFITNLFYRKLGMQQPPLGFYN
jgi:hypothetical protein